MFGGVGFYARGLFFAIADNDTIYFKVDATTRPAYLGAGMRPFQPFGPDSAPMNGYFELPPRLLEDVDELATWMRAAIAVAASAKLKPKLSQPRRTAALPSKSAPSRRRPRTSPER
jgi:DNA transformation protein